MRKIVEKLFENWKMDGYLYSSHFVAKVALEHKCSHNDAQMLVDFYMPSTYLH